jgi:predicted nucleotidyltransferase
MENGSTRERFAASLDALIENVKGDRSILAVLLCGSLSHDTVWAKSDIDLVLVTIDDKKLDRADLTLDASGVNVHAILLPRAEFRAAVEGAVRSSFMHSFLAKGKLLYTRDPTIADLCSGLGAFGERDARVQILRAGTGALPPIYKAHKWLITRGDLEYTALWILYAATPLAQVEVIGARQLVGRDVIPQAIKLNPGLFKTIYTDMLNEKKKPRNIQAALAAIDAYMAERAPRIFGPILEYLREVGETRSCTEIDAHFRRNFDVGGVITACEYLADRGVIGRGSTPVQLTKKSNVQVQELAFFSTSETTDGF